MISRLTARICSRLWPSYRRACLTIYKERILRAFKQAAPLRQNPVLLLEFFRWVRRKSETSNLPVFVFPLVIEETDEGFRITIDAVEGAHYSEDQIACIERAFAKVEEYLREDARWICVMARVSEDRAAGFLDYRTIGRMLGLVIVGTVQRNGVAKLTAARAKVEVGTEQAFRATGRQKDKEPE